MSLCTLPGSRQTWQPLTGRSLAHSWWALLDIAGSPTQSIDPAVTAQRTVQVPVSANVTCSSNRTCVFELVEDAFFNLEDSVITRSRHSFVTTEPDLLKVYHP